MCEFIDKLISIESWDCMPKCIYKECQFEEKFSLMPAWARIIYLIVSFLITTRDIDNGFSFSTIAILYFPLLFEYLTLTKSGNFEKKIRKSVYKFEFIISCIMLTIALFGLFDIIQIGDIGNASKWIYINNKFYGFGGFGINFYVFWYSAAGLTILFSIIDAVLVPNRNSPIVSPEMR